MAKLITSATSIMATDDDGRKIIEAFKTLIEKVPEKDLLKLAQLVKKKPFLLKMGLPYLSKLEKF